jgi:hypothetical protein
VATTGGGETTAQLTRVLDIEPEPERRGRVLAQRTRRRLSVKLHHVYTLWYSAITALGKTITVGDSRDDTGGGSLVAARAQGRAPQTTPTPQAPSLSPQVRDTRGGSSSGGTNTTPATGAQIQRSGVGWGNDG